jgi:hypothetical protein
MDLLTDFDIIKTVNFKINLNGEEKFQDISLVRDRLTTLTFIVNNLIGNVNVEAMSNNLDYDAIKAMINLYVRSYELLSIRFNCDNFSKIHSPMYSTSVYKLKSIKNGGEDFKNTFGYNYLDYNNWNCEDSFRLVSQEDSNYDYCLLLVRNDPESKLASKIISYYKTDYNKIEDVAKFSRFNNNIQVLIPRDFYEANPLFSDDTSVILPTYLQYMYEK